MDRRDVMVQDLKGVKEFLGNKYGAYPVCFDAVINELSKTARNVNDTVAEQCEFKCSNCGIVIKAIRWNTDGVKIRFCPFCGTPIVEED